MPYESVKGLVETESVRDYRGATTRGGKYWPELENRQQAQDLLGRENV